MDPFPLTEECPYPHILLVTSEAMKKLYLKHHRILYFDLTFSLISEKYLDIDKKSLTQWLVGFLIGVNENYKTIIFGFTIMKGQKKTDYNIVLTSFIRFMGCSPDTIISDR